MPTSTAQQGTGGLFANDTGSDSPMVNAGNQKSNMILRYSVIYQVSVFLTHAHKNIDKYRQPQQVTVDLDKASSDWD